MKLHLRLWIVFSLIWIAGSAILYVFIVNIYNERALESQRQTALSQGYTITGRISGLLPTFPERAEGYLDYYSSLFNIRLLLLTPEKKLTYDSFNILRPDETLSLAILSSQADLPNSMYVRTTSYGFVQYTLFPIDHRLTSGYLLMIKDVNLVQVDISKFRNQVLWILGIATAGSFIIFYLIASWFTEPIRRMISYLQRITPQNRHFTMKYKRQDEIGHLVEEIKQMVHQVNVYEQRQRRFISTSSHELKTPLTTMQLISENLPSLRESEELHREYINDLQVQIDKMRHTVQGMLDVYRLADQPLQPTDIAVSDIVDHINEQFQHVADNKHIHIVYRTEVTSLYVDKDLFLRGLDNLVSNAIRYSAENSDIRITFARNKANQVVCSVCDQGIGIEEQDIPYIFEPFYRSSQAMGWSQEGSGLGLAIVKQMVDLHGGQIEVRSIWGEGTCIDMTFRNKSVTR